MDLRVFHYPNKLLQLRDGNLPTPLHVYLDTTKECNHSCWYCYDFIGASLGIRREAPDRASAPTSELLRILEELAGQGVQALDFCGGEPLLHPDSVMLLRRCVQLNLKFGIVTNGTILSDELKELIGQHAAWIRFSIDTFDARLFFTTRRPASPDSNLSTVLKNMQTLLDFRTAIGRTDLRVGANCVVDRRHVDSLYTTVKQCKTMRLDYVRFAFVSAGASVKARLYPREVVESILSEVERARSFEDESFAVVAPDPRSQLAPPSRKKGFPYCYWSLLTLTIDVDGNVYSCPDMKHDARFKVGSLRERPLTEILSTQERWRVAHQTADCVNCCHLGFNRMLREYFETTPNQLPFI